jgi:hypothetical protein
VSYLAIRIHHTPVSTIPRPPVRSCGKMVDERGERMYDANH